MIQRGGESVSVEPNALIPTVDELTFLELHSRGMRFKQIAAYMELSVGNVSSALVDLYGKIGANNGPHAVSLCIDRGLLIPQVDECVENIKLRSAHFGALATAATGLTIKQAAPVLGQTPDMVSKRRREVIKKLGARSIVHAVRIGIISGLIDRSSMDQFTVADPQ